MNTYHDLATMDYRASCAMRIAMRKQAIESLRHYIRLRQDVNHKCLRLSLEQAMHEVSPERSAQIDRYVEWADDFCRLIRFDCVPGVIEWIRDIDAAIYDDGDLQTRH